MRPERVIQPAPAGPALQRRYRTKREAAVEASITFACLVLWVAALLATAAFAAWMGRGSLAAPVGMLVLAASGWGLAEYLCTRKGMEWPGSMLGLVSPICAGFGAALLADPGEAMPADKRFAIITAVAALGMTAFLFRFRLPKLVSPIITFTIVSLFLTIRGFSLDTVQKVEGFSPRGIIAALVDEPFYMASFGLLAAASMVFARYLDLRAQMFGMTAARPLHFIGIGVVCLIAARLAVLLPVPLAFAALALLFALTTAWAIRIDRIGVMLCGWFAMAKPLVATVLAVTGGTLTLQDWSVAHMAVMGASQIVWVLVRKPAIRAGLVPRPRNVVWNWPDRVIYPYRPPPGYR